MKKLLLIFIMTFIFHNLIKADDIKDFEIEGISLGDSALDHFDINEIIQRKENGQRDCVLC